MCAEPHLSGTVRKLLSRKTAILCLIALISLTTGVMQSLPHLTHARSATVVLAHRNGSACFENLDVECAVFPANAHVFHVIANPHCPKAAVTFIAETPVDSRRQSRAPPSV
jgi:hypothetical protein